MQFKETRELIEGVSVIVQACIRRLSDGFQPSDLPLLVAELANNPKVATAISGASLVKAEFEQMTPEKTAEAIKELAPAMTDLVVGVVVSLRAKS
mgnify:CR=1 FL=1